MVYIWFYVFVQNPNAVIQLFRSISQIQAIKPEHTGVCMACHCQWLISSSPIKHFTHTPPPPSAQELCPTALQKVWVFDYISSEHREHLGRNKWNLRIFPGWFPYCFSSLHGIETTLDFYMIKGICGTNPRNLFLFPCLTPPGDRKENASFASLNIRNCEWAFSAANVIASTFPEEKKRLNSLLRFMLTQLFLAPWAVQKSRECGSLTAQPLSSLRSIRSWKWI